MPAIALTLMFSAFLAFGLRGSFLFVTVRFLLFFLSKEAGLVVCAICSLLHDVVLIPLCG